MSYSVPSDIYNVVHPIASQQGVPDALWEDVVYVESSFNPRAYNPSGAYGLFQLLTPGGQGDNAIRAGYTANDLYDPKVNATYGMPAVASAWSHLKGSFNPNDIHWWEQFAAESGHPGGSSSNAYTQEVARTLMQDYQGDSNPIQDAVNNVTGAVNNATNAANFLQGINTTNVHNALVKTGVLGINTTNVHNALVKTGVFLVATTILVIGFVLVAKRPTS